jgi:hypothetical protein
MWLPKMAPAPRTAIFTMGRLFQGNEDWRQVSLAREQSGGIIPSASVRSVEATMDRSLAHAASECQGETPGFLTLRGSAFTAAEANRRLECAHPDEKGNTRVGRATEKQDRPEATMFGKVPSHVNKNETLAMQVSHSC